jgi:hypothetical protein
MQFIAGLTVILDLIGPEPLRLFGRRLISVPWRKGFSKPAEVAAVVVFLASLVAYIGFLILGLVSDFFKPAREWLSRLYFLESGWGLGISLAVLYVFTLLIFLGGMTDEAHKSKGQYEREAGWALVLAPAFIVAGIVLLVILLPWAVFIYGICLPLSKGLAALLDRARPAHPLRWAAFFLFIAGFHFDLLAS